MTKKELSALIKAVEEPLGWDCRGSDEEYRYMEKANKAFDKLKKLLKQHIEPSLPD